MYPSIMTHLINRWNTLRTYIASINNWAQFKKLGRLLFTKKLEDGNWELEIIDTPINTLLFNQSNIKEYLSNPDNGVSQVLQDSVENIVLQTNFRTYSELEINPVDYSLLKSRFPLLNNVTYHLPWQSSSLKYMNQRRY